MSAPALVMLAQSTHDPVAEQGLHRLRKRLQEARETLSVSLAFSCDGSPTITNVATVSAERGHQEAVVVPLSLTRATGVDEDVERCIKLARKDTPTLDFEISKPVGPATELLNVLDRTVRAALAKHHVVELDALVLSVPDQGDVRGRSLLARRARQWSAHHRLPVQCAVADGSGQSISQAITTLRQQGRRSIAVGSLFLTEDQLYRQQEAAALASGAAVVAAPLFDDSCVVDLILSRYAFAAMALLDKELMPARQPEVPTRIAAAGAGTDDVAIGAGQNRLRVVRNAQ